jgi:peptidoglycan/LPS O-acetylase OafA/YrhL
VKQADSSVTQLKKSRVNEIDLLRFVAAMGVVFFHYAFFQWFSSQQYPYLAPIAKYGYLGVQLFFMISGFVITMSATREKLKVFIVSRIVRLYPAFWACCTLTFLIVSFLHKKGSFTFVQYMLNMTMLSGFIGVPSIDSVYWTLFVEIRFYVLVAIILAIGQIKKVESLLVIWSLLSIVLYLCPDHLIVRFLRIFLITSYSAFFIAGTSFFLVWSRGLTPLRTTIIFAMCVLGIVQTIADIPAKVSMFQGTAVSPYVVSVSIIIFFSLMTLISLRVTGFWGRKSWSLAGSLSYPLYLIHGQIGYAVFEKFVGQSHRYALLTAVIAGALITAYSVNRLVERPLAPMLKSRLETIFGKVHFSLEKVAG